MWVHACSIPLAFPFSEWQNSVKIPSRIDIPTALTHIGDHIKKKRLETKTRIKDVIEALSISRQTLTGWEQKTYSPAISQYPKIIEFLGYYPFPDDTQTLGGKIKKYRMSHGLTRKAFARIINSCPAAIKNWEHNVSAPKAEKVNMIRKLLAIN